MPRSVRSVSERMRALEEELVSKRGDRETWLVYGDLLQEQNDPRGELIALDDAMFRSKTARDAAVVRGLYESMVKDSLKEMLFEGAEDLEPKFRYGHLESITVRSFAELEQVLERPCSKFLSDLKWTTPMSPCSSSRPEPPDMSRLVRLLEKVSLRSLAVGVEDDSGGNIGSEGAEVLAGHDGFKGLERIALRGTAVGFAGAKALSESKYLEGLKVLDLSFNEIGDGGATAIAESKHLGQLEELTISYNGIAGEGAESIAKSENLQSVKRLQLDSNSIGNDGVRAIAGNMELELLGVEHNGINGEGAAAIFGAEKMRGLLELDLRSNLLWGLTPKSFRLENLRRLVLERTVIGLAMAEIMPRLAHVEALDLSENDLGDDSIQYVARTKFGRLRSLRIFSGDITSGGARDLVASEHLRGLEQLDLGCNRLGDQGAKEIAASANLGNLTELDLRANVIGEEGVKAIETSEKLGKLQTVNLVRNETKLRHLRRQGGKWTSVVGHERRPLSLVC